MSRSTRRRLPLVVALVAATTATVAGPVFGAENVTTRRLEGENRYATAAAIAQATFPSGTNTAVLASGLRFPDALASAYLTGRLRAPLLLTGPDSVPAATEAKLQQLGVDGITIVGGTAVVSEAVVTRLRQLGYVVDRISGRDRYETAREIAERFPASFVGALGTGGATAIVASGENFPDALAGAPISYAESFPVLLTPKASLSPQALAALKELAITQVVLLGGPAAVSEDVRADLEAEGITVLRLSGDSREATAAEIADFAVDTLEWSATHVNLARGNDFADALAGGPHEGQEQAPLLLTTSPSVLGAPTAAWLQDRSATVSSIDVLGGRSAVNDSTVEAARQAATSQP